jgi:predicted esterase
VRRHVVTVGLIGCGCLLVLLAGSPATADGIPTAARTDSGFVDRVFHDEEGDHRYVVFVPPGAPPEEGWPVILFLHGAGERGRDGTRPLAVGLGPIVRRRAGEFSAVVVFPQCEDVQGPILGAWGPDTSDGRRALAMLAEVERTYPINPARRVLTGWSMGGYGAWSLAAADPERWSAVLPLSGGCGDDEARRLVKVPVWCLHGARDRIVRPSESRAAVAALREAGGQPLYQEIADGGHDIWKRVYASSAVLDWMLAPQPRSPVLESLPFPEEAGLTEELQSQPFVPALLVHRAISVRAGNEALRALAEGIPAALRDAPVAGELDDVRDQVTLDGQTLDVRFEELTYGADVAHVEVAGSGADRMSLGLSVRNFRLMIERIVVSTGAEGFTAGPVQIVMGHREPLTLSLEVRPAVRDGALVLHPLRTVFAIPDHNWYVERPAQIVLQGDLLTEREVETAVVGGLYVRRATIEEQVRGAVPELLDRLVARVDFTRLADLITVLWPLPVYEPQLRVQLESVSTDASGASLGFAVTAAAFDPGPEGEVREVTASAPDAFRVPHGQGLLLNVGTEVLDHLSALLAGTPATRIHASDIPDRPFAALTRPAAVGAAFAAASRPTEESELQAVFSLQSPFQIGPGEVSHESAGDHAAATLLIDVPHLAFEYLERPGPRSDGGGTSVRRDGRPLFIGRVAIRQPVHLAVQQVDAEGTTLEVGWTPTFELHLSPEPEIPVSESPAGATPVPPDVVNIGHIERLLAEGWRSWNGGTGPATIRVPALAVGDSRMSLSSLSWSGRALEARFAAPVTTLINDTETPLIYRVRGLATRWSPWRTIPAGDTDRYETGTPLVVESVWQRVPERQQAAAGSQWVWRSEGRERPRWVPMEGGTTRPSSEKPSTAGAR